MKTRFVLFSLLIFAHILPGCGTTQAPLERALSSGQAIVEKSHARAWELSEKNDGILIQARYNPCGCEAPPVELHLFGVWHRHIIHGEEALLEELHQRGELLMSSGELSFLRLQGQLSGENDELAGIKYPVFILEEFVVD